MEVKVAQEILQTMGFRVFVPLVAACPGCGRTTSTTFQELARLRSRRSSGTRCRSGRRNIRASRASTSRSWAASSTARAKSKHADIGISLPGTGEAPAAPVFIDGKKAVTLRGPTVAADFKTLVIDYIERRFGSGSAGRTAAE